MKLEFSRQIFENGLKYQTDMKLIVAFRNLANAPKNWIGLTDTDLCFLPLPYSDVKCVSFKVGHASMRTRDYYIGTCIGHVSVVILIDILRS
jgi:hypothetical protein